MLAVQGPLHGRRPKAAAADVCRPSGWMLKGTLDGQSVIAWKSWQLHLDVGVYSSVVNDVIFHARGIKSLLFLCLAKRGINNVFSALDTSIIQLLLITAVI